MTNEKESVISVQSAYIERKKNQLGDEFCVMLERSARENGEETGDSKMRWKWPKFCNLEECIKGMRDSRWRRGYYGATDGMFKI